MDQHLVCSNEGLVFMVKKELGRNTKLSQEVILTKMMRPQISAGQMSFFCKLSDRLKSSILLEYNLGILLDLLRGTG